MTTPDAAKVFIIHLSPGQSFTDGTFPVLCGARGLTEAVTTNPETFNCPVCWVYWEEAAPGLSQELPKKFYPAGDPGEIAQALRQALHWLKDNPAEYEPHCDTWYSTTVNGNGYAVQLESTLTAWVYPESPARIETQEILATATIALENDGPYLDENDIELSAKHFPSATEPEPEEKSDGLDAPAAGAAGTIHFAAASGFHPLCGNPQGRKDSITPSRDAYTCEYCLHKRIQDNIPDLTVDVVSNALSGHLTPEVHEELLRFAAQDAGLPPEQRDKVMTEIDRLQRAQNFRIAANRLAAARKAE